MLNFGENLANHWLGSDYMKILLVGVASRVLVFTSAIIGSVVIGTNPLPGIYDISVPIVNLFSRWDGGQYAKIAVSGYASGTDPLVEHWAWLPLYPFLMSIVGRPFFLILAPFEAVMLAGFLISNCLFFVSLMLFYKLSEKILNHKKLAFLSSIFFAFWPGSLFYSCVYSESLFMTLALGAFYFLEKGKTIPSTLLGFLAGLTRSNGFLVAIPFLYQGLKKKSRRIIVQLLIFCMPYLLFTLFGYFSTGVFLVREVVINKYWGKQPFLLVQLAQTEQGYAILFFVEFCLVLFPFIYLFLSKELLVGVFSLGLKNNREEAKYYGYSSVLLVNILFYSIIRNIHRYAIPMLPLYWVAAILWNKTLKPGVILLVLMASLLSVGTILFSTWRFYW